MTIDDNVSFGKISNTDINGRCITPYLGCSASLTVLSLPRQGDWQCPVLTTWRTLGFLVITKVSGLWTKMWPRDQWCDTAKGSGACEGHDQTRHSRYTAYPPARPRPHSLLLAAIAGAAQGLPPLRLELPRDYARDPASRFCL